MGEVGDGIGGESGKPKRGGRDGGKLSRVAVRGRKGMGEGSARACGV